MVFEIVTISLAFSISFFKSWKATLMLWSVALCCSSILLSIPTIPDLILELTGVTDGLGVELGLVELIGDDIGAGLSHALAAMASFKAL